VPAAGVGTGAAAAVAADPHVGPVPTAVASRGATGRGNAGGGDGAAGGTEAGGGAGATVAVGGGGGGDAPAWRGGGAPIAIVDDAVPTGPASEGTGARHAGQSVWCGATGWAHSGHGRSDIGSTSTRWRGPGA